MSSVAVPSSIAAKRRIPWLASLAIATAIVGVIWLAYFIKGRGAEGVAPGQFYSVVPMDMDITISKDGELAAVNNVEITSPVEGQNTIVDIAKEGDFVHKGDVICKLDSSDIERKIEQATLDLQKAQSDVASARETKEIQESTNSANLEAANTDLILARLDLQQYVEGQYPSTLQTTRTDVEMSKITVKNKEDDLAQTRSLFSKGFVTAAEVKAAELELLKAKNDLDQNTTALQVLEKYTHEKDVTSKKNAVAQTEKRLARTQRENAVNLAGRLAYLQQCDQTLALRKQQLEHLQEQCTACTIKAPQDGMVVYSSSGSSMWGRRDTPIQPGAQVRWQELIIRLPDTSSMKAVCKINEQQASKLRVDKNNPMRALVKIVGQTEPVGAWLSNISIMADSGQRWFSPDSKDYPVDLTLDTTPAGLKPGMGVDSLKIFVDHVKQATAVPLGEVYAAGNDSYVFVRHARDAKPTKVQIGQVNDTHAQIASGVSVGDQVLILEAGQGRDLLEKAGIKVTTPSATTQPSGKMRRPGQDGPRNRDAGPRADATDKPAAKGKAAPTTKPAKTASASAAE